MELNATELKKIRDLGDEFVRLKMTLGNGTQQVEMMMPLSVWRRLMKYTDEKEKDWDRIMVSAIDALLWERGY
jgi:hypothetical protein